MKKYFVLVSLLFTALSAYSMNQPHYDVCLECSENESKAKFREYLLNNANNSCNEPNCSGGPSPDSDTFQEINGYYYTSTGTSNGYALTGSVSGSNVMIRTSPMPPIKAKKYFDGMEDVLLAYREFIQESQNYMDRKYEEAVLEYGTPLQKTALGQCNSAFPFNSSLSSQNPNTRNQIISNIGNALNGHEGTIEARVNQLNLNLSRDFGAQVQVVFNQENGYIRQTFANGGYLQFNLDGSPGSWVPNLNLGASRFGTGVVGFTGSGPNMHFLFTADAALNFKPLNITLSFTDDCMEEEWEEFLESINATVEPDFPFPANAGAYGDYCGMPYQTDTTYYWREWRQSATARQNPDGSVTITITGSWIPRSTTITENSGGNPCSDPVVTG